jgi:hypothetical protein
MVSSITIPQLPLFIKRTLMVGTNFNQGGALHHQCFGNLQQTFFAGDRTPFAWWRQLFRRINASSHEN